mmetsp:Transcript_18519/g.31552  ORF Transcript_18519/g.31552 Transcript_18519/m.31552 type:complete len:260 (+) Transcript_18519:102-881(+)
MLDAMDYILHSSRMLDVTDFRADGPGESLSLWLEPDDVVYAQTAENMVSEHSAHPFTPHITLAALVRGERETVLRVAAQVAASSSGFDVEFQRVQAGPTHYQTAYLAADASAVPGLLDLRRKAYAALGGAGTPPSVPEHPFVPHMSLAYHEPGSRRRVGLVERLEPDALTLLRGFRARSLSVWLTDIDDLTTRSWKRLACFPLGAPSTTAARCSPAPCAAPSEAACGSKMEPGHVGQEPCERLAGHLSEEDFARANYLL